MRAERIRCRNVDGRLPEADLKLLNDFRSKIDRISNNLCPVCNECFPSIELVQGECRRCHSEKGELKSSREEIIWILEKYLMNYRV